MTAAHVLFSGRVQGVGFRYTTQRLAQGLNLCGWVRNQPNGDVEMIAEGEKEVVEELLSLIDQRFEGNIQDRQINFQPSTKQFHSFQIVF